MKELMESYCWIALIMLSYFLLQHCVSVYNQNQQRKFELEKIKIRTSRRNVVAPMALNLIGELTNYPEQMSKETAKELIDVLNRILEIIKLEPEKQAELEEPKNSLMEILERANLGADFATKVQQIIEWISEN